jgi:hypothetical protein
MKWDARGLSDTANVRHISTWIKVFACGLSAGLLPLFDSRSQCDKRGSI